MSADTKKPGPLFNWELVYLDGKLISKKKVGEVGEDTAKGRRVTVYVVARGDVSAEELGKLAFNAYCLRRMREQRAEFKKRGLCKCGNPLDTDGTSCSWCRKLSKRQKERTAAREAGEDVPTPNRKETRDEKRQMQDEELELRLLKQISLVLDRHGVAALRDWLRKRQGFLEKKKERAA